MKTFNDLKFEPHGNRGEDFPLAAFVQDETLVGVGAVQARLDFDNDYGISVLTGSEFFHISEAEPYELGLFHKGHLVYDDDLFTDVIGFCDEKRVTEIMAYIQEKTEKDATQTTL